MILILLISNLPLGAFSDISAALLPELNKKIMLHSRKPFRYYRERERPHVRSR